MLPDEHVREPADLHPTFHRGLYLLLLCATLCLCTHSRAAVGFIITPSSINSTSGGLINLQITGLTNGETIVVQKFLDANSNGLIDDADLLVQQFSLSDGQASVIGGVTNFNVPGDTDPGAGQITAQL